MTHGNGKVHDHYSYSSSSQTKEIIVGLAPPGKELDDRSRFKLTIKYAALVDNQALFKFCKKDKQTLAICNTVVDTRPILYSHPPVNRHSCLPDHVPSRPCQPLYPNGCAWPLLWSRCGTTDLPNPRRCCSYQRRCHCWQRVYAV